MASMHRITPCLWFENQAEEAAKFYVSIFPGSEINAISHYPKEGQEVHHQPEGSVLTVDFTLQGQRFTALNGGPEFKFNEAISFQVFCDTQAEIDSYWEKLTAGGEEGQCGWLKDRYGVSWQVSPAIMSELLLDPDTAKRERVFKAFMKMRKFDIATVLRAANNQ